MNHDYLNNSKDALKHKITFDIVQTLPGLVLVKDHRYHYVTMNSGLAMLVGFKNADASVGKTDYDLPCKAKEFADEFIQLDKKALAAGQQMVTLDIQHYTEGWVVSIVERNPLFDENHKPIGLFDYVINVTNTPFYKRYLSFFHLDRCVRDSLIKPASYLLNDKYVPLPLTARQQECLFLLIRGKTAKQIGAILRLSKRTVEGHLNRIKETLNCYSKSQLLEKAIDSGFFYYIPKALLKEDTETW